jgi:cupin fold WbuC family metalloprotein
MIVIDRRLTSSIAEEAGHSPRLRKNRNFHTDFADPVNRMLNAFEPGTYVRPHKHESPDKFEAFIILTGRALAVHFDDMGKIKANSVLDSASGAYGVEFAPREWHTIISLATETVLYEVKPGPYAPLSDKDFAPWAPVEGSPQAADYVHRILTELGMA